MFSCGPDKLHCIFDAIERTTMAAEQAANRQALALHIPEEDAVSVEGKVEKIANEAFSYIKDTLQQNKELDPLTLQMMLPNIKEMTTSFVEPFSKSLRHILKTGVLPDEAKTATTLVNSIL